ncbi:MAG: hypothetical protein ABI675_22070 [Chitinophagaceae bacterium]
MEKKKALTAATGKRPKGMRNKGGTGEWAGVYAEPFWRYAIICSNTGRYLRFRFWPFVLQSKVGRALKKLIVDPAPQG